MKYRPCSNKGRGPCFFYTGNEGPLEEFYYNTGFPFDHAPELNALIIFAEHRFYGGSRPFGDSPTRQQMGLLSVEQALADYAVLIEALEAEHGLCMWMEVLRLPLVHAFTQRCSIYWHASMHARVAADAHRRHAHHCARWIVRRHAVRLVPHQVPPYCGHGEVVVLII
jgi:hypothetical protein